MMTDAEITETTIAEVIENSKEVLAADLVQVVEELKSTKPEEVKIVKVKPIETPEYFDPIEEEYFIQRDNSLGMPRFQWRNTPEGIAAIHETIRFMGDEQMR
ncbi:MAG: hypothetical protein WC254_05330 [Candidatus Woesearchaeota archaeon]|jgi:hypothetical protein